MIKVFIDGKEGTTGLRIYERISSRNDIELIVLSEEERKNPNSRRQALSKADIAFLCLPDAAAVEAVELAKLSNAVIIDASTAHRTNPDWAYGFPELSDAHRAKIASSKRIAVPGCHASGFVSLIYPLVSAGIVPDDLLVSAFSLTGYSGGGKKMIAEYTSTQRSGLLDAPRQYGLTQKHKHLPEMSAVTGLLNAPAFSPIVADYYSGMEVTVPLFSSQINGTAEDIKNVYRKLYCGKIVSYREDFGENGFASGNALSGLDNMEITVSGNDERILLISRFDNLGKGASGAAVECMNIVLGLEDGFGLNIPKERKLS